MKDLEPMKRSKEQGDPASSLVTALFMCQEDLTSPAASQRALSTAPAHGEKMTEQPSIPAHVPSRAVSTTVCDYRELPISGQAQAQVSSHLL